MSGVERRLSKAATAKGKLQRLALDLLQRKAALGEIPTSIRFLFYELEQAGLQTKVIPNDGKTHRKPAQNLTDAVMHLREVGLVPWDWIVDDTRTLHEWRFADSVAGFVAESVPRARVDRWPGVLRPVILTESRTIGGVFARGIARDYLCPVAPTNGQVGGFLVTIVAPLLGDENTRVLYVGDHDLAGDQIEANTRRVLERHTGRAFDEETWERVALTAAQVEGLVARGVPPIAKTDHRYNDGHPHEAFEAEALGQRPITELLRERLDELIPEPLTDVQEREEREREAVRRLLEARRDA